MQKHKLSSSKPSLRGSFEHFSPTVCCLPFAVGNSHKRERERESERDCERASLKSSGKTLNTGSDLQHLEIIRSRSQTELRTQFKPWPRECGHYYGARQCKQGSSSLPPARVMTTSFVACAQPPANSGAASACSLLFQTTTEQRGTCCLHVSWEKTYRKGTSGIAFRLAARSGLHNVRNGRCSLQQLQALVPSVSQFCSRYVLQAAATLLPTAANNQRLTYVTETSSERGPMSRFVPAE
eukprot:1932846-Amphidinium_carterae.1